MIIIFCGEDIVGSYNRFTEYRQNKIDKGYEVIELNSSNLISEIGQHIVSSGLFSTKKIICGEHMLRDKKSRDTLKNYQAIDTEIVLFETSQTERDLKFVFPSARFFNSKLSSTVFTLLDSLIPGNLRNAMSQLWQNIGSDNELLIFYLIKSRIRELILVKKNMFAETKLKSWQIGKLKAQASGWRDDKLLSCYNNLFKIERNVKTSGSTFSVQQSLELLFCFYL